MALKPETLRKKHLVYETLPQFLARMTLVWEDRQRRLAEAPARAVGAWRRWADKQDPEVLKAIRREASARYALRHPERIAAKNRRADERKKAARAAARAERTAQKAAQAAARKLAQPARLRVHAALPLPQPDQLARAWYGGAEGVGHGTI